MVDFNDIQNQLNNDSVEEKDTVTVELITLSGVQNLEVEEGMTIKEFKETNNLDGMKIVNEDGDVMNNNDTIDFDSQFFISAPKKNG